MKSAVLERPIIFTGESVLAILAGTKTQTRRVVRIQPILEMAYLDTEHQSPAGLHWTCHSATRIKAAWPEHGNPEWDFCPYGAPGDRLWVRETWTEFYSSSQHVPVEVHDVGLRYRADGSERIIMVDQQRYGANITADGGLAWRSPMFMPRKFSRLTLEITEVRVHRVQDISDEDARAEGELGCFGYQMLWDSINARRGYGWEKNPWVWAITFRRLEAM